MTQQPRHPARRPSQAGFSLIELMISMVVGLVVIGAMFAAYVGSGLSSRNTRAMSQITEDASIALSVLRSAIAATGYIVVVNSNDTGNFVDANGNDGRSNTLRGCNSAFSNPDTPVLSDLECDDGGDQADAIAVSYAADAENSAVDGDGNPLDCLGAAVDPDANGVRTAYQRFFVDSGALHCQGPGNDGSQALVDNVADMVILYGVGGDQDTPDEHRVVRYMDAADILAQADSNAFFDKVLSVRVCVTVASADNVLDAVTQYVDCNGDRVDPPGGTDDRKMYRSFTTTIVLQNRLEAP